jgi:hypothetical protein
MWGLKKSDGPEPEITPEHGFLLVLTALAFWCWLNFACPWMGTAHTFPLVKR